VRGLVISAVSATSVEARYAADGSLAWQLNLLNTVAGIFPGDPPDMVDPVSLVEDGHGGLTLRARFSSSLGCIPWMREMLVSLDAATGAVQWARDLKGNTSAMVGDEAGNSYIAGSFEQDGGYVMGLASFTPGGGSRWLVRAPWVPAMAASSGQVAMGTRLWSTTDGALLEPSPLAPDPGTMNVFDDEAPLLAANAVYAFGTQNGCCPTCECPAMVPKELLRSVRRDAWPLWDVGLSSGIPTEPVPVLSAGALTADGDVLFAQSSGIGYRNSFSPPPMLRAVTSQGTERFACDLPGTTVYDDVLYRGATMLQQGRWVAVLQEQCFVCNQEPPPQILSFDLPGLDLAPSGWPTAGGSNRRAGRPR